MPYNFDQLVDRRRSDSTKWHKYDADVLPLWIADMDFPSPEPVIRALRQRVEHGCFGYSMELPEFNETVVERLHRRYGWSVSPEALVVLPGVIAGFNLACRVATAPGDGLLLQVPLYPPILRVPGNVGLSSDEAELRRQPDGRYVIDFDAFEAAITPRTRAFVLCNPHNPVGRVFTTDELTRMAEICLRHNLVICADEIHCDLLFSGHRHVPIASLAAEIAERTITLMAPSKTFNLPGLKCAFAIIPDAELREKFKAARADLVPQMVNVLGYTAALAAYRDGQPWLDELLRYLEANRDVVSQYVQAHLPGVTVGKPEGTYLAWLDCRQAPIPDGDPYTFFLDKARVALNDGATFGRGGQGFVRLNFGCPRLLLLQALERLQKALETL
jgi:cystathionine beta-lyase